MKDLERCGWCGRFFIKDKILTEEEVMEIDSKILENAPNGNCPDSQAEYWEMCERDELARKEEEEFQQRMWEEKIQEERMKKE